MPDRVDLAEFRIAFVAEADDHLVAARAKLLAIDNAVREGRVAPREVRDVFRALHTIKGLASMVSIEAIVVVTHHMEEVVRTAERAGGVLGAEAVECLLAGAAMLERAVRAVERGEVVDPPPPALLARLAALPSPSSPAATSAGPAIDPEIDEKLTPFEREQLTSAPASGRRAVRADFVPTPGKAARGLTINSVRERTSALGEIVRVVPLSTPRTANAPGGLSFALLVVTSASDEDIAAAAGCAPESIRTLVGARPAEPAPGEDPSGPPSVSFTAAADPIGAPLAPDEESDAPQRRNVLRVEATRIDEAMDGLAALIVTRSRLGRAAASLAASGVDVRELTAILGDHARQLRELRASLLRVRMVRVGEMLERLPLLARGQTRQVKKAVHLAVDAGDAELDKSVAERLFPALLHLVRNAIDHGIEAPDARAAAGKPREGTVRVRSTAQSNRHLGIQVSDDGGGIDRDRVAARAGLPGITDDRQLLEAICRPGLSTRDEATSTSGRGMGMDIVQRIVVDQLGGELSLETTPGRGTVFDLRVPLTIAIVDAFTVRCAGDRFVIPVAAVEEILEIRPAQVMTGPAARAVRRASDGAEPTPLIAHRGEVVPLIALADALHLDAPPALSPYAVVVRRGGEAFAFGLDRVVSQQEAVVRPLLDPLTRVTGVSGSTDLGDGRATLVLDLVALAANILSSEQAA